MLQIHWSLLFRVAFSLAFLTRSNAYFFFWPAQKNDRDLNKSIQRLFKLASFARHLPSFLIMLLFYWNCIYRVEVSNCRNRNITGSSLGRRDFFASIRKREVMYRSNRSFNMPPSGIPRAFDTFAVPGRREFDYQSLPGGGEFDPHALGVGNLNCTFDFM